jgi:hypothetical protein
MLDILENCNVAFDPMEMPEYLFSLIVIINEFLLYEPKLLYFLKNLLDSVVTLSHNLVILLHYLKVSLLRTNGLHLLHQP